MSLDSEPLLLLREACASHVTQGIYTRYGDALTRFGARGKQVCREDVLSHLDYLACALAARTAAPFTQYVLWLNDVLSARSVPTTHLDYSLELISAFLSEQLQDESGTFLQGVLQTARSSLTDGSTSVHYGTMRLESFAQASTYKMAMLQGHRVEALGIVATAMDAGASLTDVSVRIVQPALYEVGTLWQKNHITVSQEHLATAMSQNVLVGAYMKGHFSPSNGKLAAFACVQGNHHVLGLRMVSDAFETRGWESAYLGADVPTRDLVRDMDARRPQCLALSASLPQHLITARQAIEALRSELGNACPSIWIGGIATLSGESVWRHTQADGWAYDALHALEQL